MSERDIFKNKRSHSIVLKKDDLVINQSLLPVMISSRTNTQLDWKTVSFKYYNSFNFSKLAATLDNTKMSIGITSANRSDGKTLVAANMAVSLARGYRQKTLLLDMNFSHPNLHNVFGTDLSPGMAEAITFKKIRVEPTSVQNLYLMTAGNNKDFPVGIEHTLSLRHILYSLKNKFDFVLIDMSSILPIKNFPIHFINEIDGLIGVIDSRKTKKGEYNKMLKHLDEEHFIGYIFNRVSDL